MGMSVCVHNSLPEPGNRKSSSAKRDLAVILGLALVAFLLSIHFNAFEQFARFSSEHESYQADETLTFISCIGLGLSVYAFRRWRETQALLQEIRVSQEKLRQSNQELEQFAYVASHDLQEPLRVISGFAELLGRRYQGKLDSNADEYISFMLGGCKRMQGLISGLLTYSRVGRKSRPFAHCDLSDVIHKAKDNLGALLAETHARIETGRLPSVFACEDELIQLFQNLIGNACKFHTEEPPVVKITAEKSAVDEITVAVADNGVGIDPQYQERIFQIFERLQSSPNHDGSGIGLAVCKKIADRHRGNIWVRSAPGTGSTFYVTLPMGNGRGRHVN